MRDLYWWKKHDDPTDAFGFLWSQNSKYSSSRRHICRRLWSIQAKRLRRLQGTVHCQYSCSAQVSQRRDKGKPNLWGDQAPCRWWLHHGLAVKVFRRSVLYSRAWLSEIACKSPAAILKSKHDQVYFDRSLVFDMVVEFELKTITMTKRWAQRLPYTYYGRSNAMWRLMSLTCITSYCVNSNP